MRVGYMRDKGQWQGLLRQFLIQSFPNFCYSPLKRVGHFQASPVPYHPRKITLCFFHPESPCHVSPTPLDLI